MNLFNLILAAVICFCSTIYPINVNLKEGMKAPNFILTDQKGKVFKLSAFRGKSPVVIYFYPKAGTSGCTKQACGIRDDFKKFKEKKIVVCGISTDSKEEIQKFISDYDLNFPLLSDENKTVSKKFGILGENGKAKRFTFIIDKDGIIRKIIEVTDISNHSTQVLEFASQL